MPTSSIVEAISNLQPDEQSIVISLIKSFVDSSKKRTEAQARFVEEVSKYEDYDMSMEEIDTIVHGE